MRTTIDLPDALFRRAKATAAVRGVTLKSLMVAAVERETQPPVLSKQVKNRPFPLIRLKHKKVLDLTDFNFDDLLP